MAVRAGHITTVTAVFITLGHVGMLPCIFFFVNRLPVDDRIDVALMIGPLTAAYFITIVRFALDNRYQRLIEGSREVNFLFVFIAAICTVPFITALYTLVYLYETVQLDTEEALKRGIGVVELFFGGAFALFADTVFGREE